MLNKNAAFLFLPFEKRDLHVHFFSFFFGYLFNQFMVVVVNMKGEKKIESPYVIRGLLGEACRCPVLIVVDSRGGQLFVYIIAFYEQ